MNPRAIAAERLAIMQPYLFPYAGYFQLAAAVDTFVFYDDVNFIKGGWINRNRLLRGGAPAYFTVPLDGASPFLRIRDVAVTPPALWRDKLIENFRHAYSRAPQYRPVIELVRDVFASADSHIAPLAKRSIRAVSDYLGWNTRFIESSVVFANADLSGQARVIDICRQSGASEYVNLPGGAALYSAGDFDRAGTRLQFLPVSLAPYRQFDAPFVPGLSIIDLLMFNDAAACRQLLAVDGRAPALAA